MFSPDETLISASAAPHCRAREGGHSGSVVFEKECFEVGFEGVQRFLSFFLSFFFSKKKGSIKCGGSKDGKGTETNSGKTV